MAKKKQLTDRQLVEACGGAQAVADYFAFSTVTTVYNWIGGDATRSIPKHWRMLLENKVAAK